MVSCFFFRCTLTTAQDYPFVSPTDIPQFVDQERLIGSAWLGVHVSNPELVSGREVQQNEDTHNLAY